MDKVMTIPEFCALLRKQQPEICEALDRAQEWMDNQPIPYAVTDLGREALK